MNRISVTDEALQNAREVLHQLSEQSEAIAARLAAALLGVIDSLDDSLQGDIREYIVKATAFKDKLRGCVEENLHALSERLAKIPDYESQVYQPRNIALS